jgi:hypothetical protein
MSDFWVTSVTYDLEPQKSIEFRNGPQCESSIGYFSLGEDRKLRVALRAQLFDSLEDAQAAVQSVLDA